MLKKILFTQQGLSDLKHEQSVLEVQRKDAVQNLQTAREMGDLSENAAYKVARARLSSIDSRLNRLKAVLAQAQVVEKTQSGEVGIGSYVKVLHQGKTLMYQIVGGYESDLSKNKISCFSPIGKALMKRKVNEVINVRTLSGEVKYKIVNITITAGV